MFLYSLQRQSLHRISEMVFAHADVAPCRLRFAMAEQLGQRRFLYAHIIEVRREGVPERM